MYLYTYSKLPLSETQFLEDCKKFQMWHLEKILLSTLMIKHTMIMTSAYKRILKDA